jgi:hypothetical protein
LGKSDDPRKGLLVRFDKRRDVVWSIDPNTGNARRNSTPALVRKEVETCGLCHARRGEFSEDWMPGRWLSDTHAVSPLARGLYSADGQMLDEVYNYGAFKQSRMFAAGVTCGDCPSRTAQNFVRRVTASACKATPRPKEKAARQAGRIGFSDEAVRTSRYSRRGRWDLADGPLAASGIMLPIEGAET